MISTIAVAASLLFYPTYYSYLSQIASSQIVFCVSLTPTEPSARILPPVKLFAESASEGHLDSGGVNIPIPCINHIIIARIEDLPLALGTLGIVSRERRQRVS